MTVSAALLRAVGLGGALAALGGAEGLGGRENAHPTLLQLGGLAG